MTTQKSLVIFTWQAEGRHIPRADILFLQEFEYAVIK